MLAPTPENFRAEIARHYLDRASICQHNGMHPNELSMYINGVRPLTGWAAHNIGYAINRATDMMIFDVDMSKGAIKATRGRPPVPLPGPTPPPRSVKLTKKKKRMKYRRPTLATGI
jgi:hypothetical protein